MHDVTDLPFAQPFAPPDGRAIYMRGLLALRDGDPSDAVCLLRQALRHEPRHKGMRRNLVRALLLTQQYEQVLTQVNAALADAPDDGELHFARGTALNALGHHAKACAAFTRAVALSPGHAPSHLNLGNAAADLDDIKSAETRYRIALRLDPALPEAHASLGYVLTAQGRLPEAVDALRTAITLRPDFAQAHWNLAVALLLAGDLRRGFAEYEWRRRHARFQADFPDLPGPRWDGGCLVGRTILVRAEQGFGDAIQFARYLPLLRRSGGSPVLQCAAPLVPLIGAMPGTRAVATGSALPDYDTWIDQISLPGLFQTTLDSIPAATGYLVADPRRVRVWRDRLPVGRRVGVTFTGNPLHPADRRRSIPLDLVSPMLSLPGIDFISLHHGTPCPGLPDLTPWLTDYAETAALIAALDLVVTVDTSVAHLAGALGKPVWLLLPHAPDWRWLLGRDDSPWYASARLFRQPRPGDWASVLGAVTAALAAE